jgi:acyl-CoA synthetase (NDP forming)
VAIIGASRNPRSFSAIMAERLRRDRPDAALHLINPGAAALPGAAAMPGGSALATLGEVTGEVDVALVVLPARGSLAALADCVDRGIPAVVLYAALQDGYAEFNGEVRRIIRGSRTRVLGPNCLGSANLYNGTSLTYGHLPGQPDGPGDAALAVIGHSGAVLQGIAMSAAELGCGVGYLVSLGNESDLAVVDFLAYFADRPEIKVIVAYLEQLRDPRRFVALAEKTRRLGKELVVLRTGVSDTGRELAASHTGAIVGEIEHEAAFMAELGIHLVASTREAAVVASAVRARAVSPGGLAVVATSGGYATIIADLAAAAEVRLPRLDPCVKSELATALSATRVVNPDVTNPLDLGVAGADDRELFERSISLLLGQESVASLLLLTNGSRLEAAGFAAAEGDRSGKPVVVATYLRDQAGLASLARRRVPVFPSEDEAVLGVAAILRYSGQPSTPRFRAIAAAEEAKWDRSRMPIGLRDHPTEAATKSWLSGLGVPTPAGILVRTYEQAREALDALRGTAVLKVADPRLTHKTDAGGVWTGITDAAVLSTAWLTMQTRLAEAGVPDPAAFLLEEQVSWSGPEWLVGVRNDFGFGPLLVFGLGGVAAEAMPSPVTAPAPLDIERGTCLVRALPAWRLLVRRRVIAAEATAQMAQFLVAIGGVAWANRDHLREADLNPVVLAPGGPVALDARLVLRVRPPGAA